MDQVCFRDETRGKETFYNNYKHRRPYFIPKKVLIFQILLRHLKTFESDQQVHHAAMLHHIDLWTSGLLSSNRVGSGWM